MVVGYNFMKKYNPTETVSEIIHSNQFSMYLRVSIHVAIMLNIVVNESQAGKGESVYVSSSLYKIISIKKPDNKLQKKIRPEIARTED